MSAIARRLPDALVNVVVDHWTAPFWDAAGDGRLTCAQCANCRRFRMPPSPFCPHCRSQQIDWPTLPGTGTVYAFTVVCRAVLPGTEDSVPYVSAVIELDGTAGCRLIATIVDCPVDSIAVGSPVRALFEPLPEGRGIVRFTLAAPGQGDPA
jgi:uncharacterized OB-fold protein